MLCSVCRLLFTSYLEQPIWPSSRVNEAKKNATQQMNQFIWGCVVCHWYWGRARAQRGFVYVMLLRGCGGEKRNRACTYRETLRCIRVNMVTWRSLILHILSMCVCVCVPLCIQHTKRMRCVMYPLVVCLLRTNNFALFRKG